MNLQSLQRLAALVEEVSGIVFPPAQLGFLADLMARRAAQAGFHDVHAYLDLLERGALDEEWRHLLPAITVKESFLFRVPEQFRVLLERILPELATARRGQPLRLWSAGCAHGEEPATLAVVLAEAGLLPGGWTIVATDVDERALQVAQEGAYSQRAVSQVPPELLRRWFQRRGDRWYLDRELLAGIDFRRVNLVREPLPELPDPFDVVLLRNVLIYFRPESQRRVVRAVADALAPDGYLFLGHSESLWQLTDRLAAVDLGGCFAYRHTVKATGATPDRSSEAEDRRRQDRRNHSGSAGTAPALGPPGSGLPGGPARGRRVDPGQPADARSGLPRPAGEAVPTPELADVTAALLANRADTAAELVATRLAAVPDDPGAHAIQGLVHDLRGDADAAIASYRAALFVAPGLYQVRLLLADALRRAGWADRARSEYRRLLGEIEVGGGVELPALAGLLPADRPAVAARARAALARS